MNVVDVGANVGYYTLLFARLSETGNVYAFEPVPEIFSILERTVKENVRRGRIQSNRVKLSQQALSDHTGSDTLYLNAFNHGDNRLYQSDGFKKITVSLLTADSVLSERIDFVKIDVQGAEVLVLRGMKNIIQKYRPVIVLEYSPRRLQKIGTGDAELFEILKDYKFSIIDEEKHVVRETNPTALRYEFPAAIFPEVFTNLLCEPR